MKKFSMALFPLKNERSVWLVWSQVKNWSSVNVSCYPICNLLVVGFFFKPDLPSTRQVKSREKSKRRRVTKPKSDQRHPVRIGEKENESSVRSLHAPVVRARGRETHSSVCCHLCDKKWT